MKETQDKPSGSFLIRVLVEPRKGEDQEPVKRYYIRDLKTGKAHYYSNPLELTEQISRQADSQVEKARQQDRDALEEATRILNELKKKISS